MIILNVATTTVEPKATFTKETSGACILKLFFGCNKVFLNERGTLTEG
jgi:hypothetical protein